jgi:hypothetical protein
MNSHACTLTDNEIQPKIVQQARNMLSLVKDRHLHQGVVSVMELFSGGDGNAHWRHLKEQYIARGSSLLSALDAVRGTLTRNTGNSNRGAGKAGGMAKVGENNDDTAKLIQNPPPANDGGPGKAFWVPDPHDPGTDTRGFRPGNYPVVTALTFQGIKTRLRAPKANNGLTHSRKVPATTYTHLGRKVHRSQKGHKLMSFTLKNAWSKQRQRGRLCSIKK